jgi:ligand-binding sensor domain-containing protein
MKTKPIIFINLKFSQKNNPFKLILIFINIIILNLFLPTTGNSFTKPLANQSKGEKFSHILKSDNFSLNARNVKVLRSKGNTLWIGTSMGVIKYDTSSIDNYKVYDNRNGLLSNGIFSILNRKKNQTWIGTYGGGLTLIDSNNLLNINTPQGLNDSFVYDQKFINDVMWIATWSGVNRVIGDPLDPLSWTSFTVKNTNGGLIDNWVYSIEVGKGDNIWFGTEAGLSLYDGKQWNKWDHKNGLGAAYEVVKDDNVLATDTFQGSHHNVQSNDLPNAGHSNYRPNYIVSMLLDKKNRLWIGTWGGGLSMFDPKSKVFRNFTVKDGLPGNYILAINQGSDGNLWIGSNKGLTSFNGTLFKTYSKINGLISDYVFSIEFAINNFIWVGGHHGITKLQIDNATGRLTRLEKK